MICKQERIISRNGKTVLFNVDVVMNNAINGKYNT